MQKETSKKYCSENTNGIIWKWQMFQWSLVWVSHDFHGYKYGPQPLQAGDFVSEYGVDMEKEEWDEKVAASCRKHTGSSIGDTRTGTQRQWSPVLVTKCIWLREGEAHSLSGPLLLITYAGLKLSTLCALSDDLLPCPTQDSFNSAAGVAGRVLQLPQDFLSL